MSRLLIYMFLLVIVTGVCLGIGACAILSQDKFGRQPEGVRLARLKMSPNFEGGEFQNAVPTPRLADGQSTLRILWVMYGPGPNGKDFG